MSFENFVPTSTYNIHFVISFFTNFDIQKCGKFHTENFRTIIYVKNSYIYIYTMQTEKHQVWTEKNILMIQQELALAGSAFKHIFALV